MRAEILVLAVLLAASRAQAQYGAAGAAPAPGQTALPEPLGGVTIEQKLDAPVPASLELRDESGRRVKLGDYLGHRPMVLALVYYDCPMLCTLVLNGLLRAARTLLLDAGEAYEIVAVSINPKETPEIAASKLEVYRRAYGRGGRGWHFLTGEEPAIRRLADAVGFRYAYDPATGQYAHASGIIVVTAGGRVSRYLYGVEYSARDLRLGLVEAASGRIGTPVDRLLLYCFHYDPKQGRYSLAILNIIRALGSLTVVALGAFLWTSFRRERRKPAA